VSFKSENRTTLINVRLAIQSMRVHHFVVTRRSSETL